MTSRVSRWLVLANWPNRISILRLVLIAPFVLLMLKHHVWPMARYAALGVFAVMAVSDLLDGLLARALNQRTRLGAILDPLADKALILCSVVLLSLDRTAIPSARVPDWIVVAVVGKDLWVILGFAVVYLTTDRFLVHPTLAGKASTATQLAMVLAVLLAPDLNRLSDGLGTKLAGVLGWAVAGVCVMAVISYTRLGLRFVSKEEKPLETPPPPVNNSANDDGTH